MSYNSSQKYNAIILIGEYGAANITTTLYEDLEKFNLINIVRESETITGATLTYSGKELFRRLKTTDEYKLVTQSNFSSLFNNILFGFKRQAPAGNASSYLVSFNNNGSVAQFIMQESAEHVWLIAATVLPEWVMETEMEFSTAIINNEARIHTSE